MQNKTAILEKLISSSPVSLEQICADCNVSQKVVKRTLENFAKDGFELETVPHVGLSIKKIPTHIVDYNLNRLIKGTAFENRVYCFDKVTSTNDVATELVNKLGITPLIVCARTQTKGRGRQGRQWFSPNDKGLWFSVAVKPEINPEQIFQLTFLAAVCTACELKKISTLPIRVKWPNDILAAGKKCGGILTELKTEGGAISHAVVGIGINFNVDKKEFTAQNLPDAVSLQAQTKTDQTTLLANLLKNISNYLQMLNEGRFDFIQKQWEQWADITGKHIRVSHNNETFEGTVKGLDPSGALLLTTPAGTCRKALCADTVTIV